MRHLASNFTSLGCSSFVSDISRRDLLNGDFREALMRKCVIWAGYKRSGEAGMMESGLSKLQRDEWWSS